MWARVSRFQIPKNRMDEDIEESRKIVTEGVKRIPGSRGVYYLVDRERGETMAVTLWEDEQSMQASEEETARIREESTAGEGGKVLGVERYEVAIQPSDVMATAR